MIYRFACPREYKNIRAEFASQEGHKNIHAVFGKGQYESFCSGQPGLDEGKTGLNLPHPSNPDEIAAKVAQMLALSAAESQKMSKAARDKVTPLTWQAHVARWEDVIRKVSE